MSRATQRMLRARLIMRQIRGSEGPGEEGHGPPLLGRPEARGLGGEHPVVGGVPADDRPDDRTGGDGGTGGPPNGLAVGDLSLGLEEVALLAVRGGLDLRLGERLVGDEVGRDTGNRTADDAAE